MKKYRLKPVVKEILVDLIVIPPIVLLLSITINKHFNNWYSECDHYYGYPTSYYTCKQFHNR